MSWQVLKISLDSHIANTISRLVIEMHFDVANHSGLFVCELDIFRDVSEGQ